MPAYPLRWIFNAIVKPMALADPFQPKRQSCHWWLFVLFLLLFISSSVFTAYAQQGKSISGGAGFGRAAAKSSSDEYHPLMVCHH